MRAAGLRAACLLAIIFPITARAERLRKIWEIDLRKSAQELGIHFAPDFPIFAINFSPDGNQLAVVADSIRTGGKKRARLFIIPNEHPDAGVSAFEVGSGIDNGEEGPIGVFGWSPSGNEIIA